MAMVTITLRDDATDDTVDIRLESEPPIPGTNTKREMTPAQMTALLMVDAVASPEDITS